MQSTSPTFSLSPSIAAFHKFLAHYSKYQAQLASITSINELMKWAEVMLQVSDSNDEKDSSLGQSQAIPSPTQ